MKEKTSEDMIAYGIYIKLLDAMKHHSSVQLLIRTISSTLLLGSFASFGYIHSIEKSVLPFLNEIGVFFLAILSLCVITTLSFLDLVCQKRYIVANFSEGLYLENKYPWFPKFHEALLKNKKAFSMSKREAFFYIGASYSLFIIVALSAMVAFEGIHNLFTDTMIGALTILGMFLYTKLLLKVSGKFEKLVKITSKA